MSLDKARFLTILEHFLSLIAGTSHGINFEDMDVAALLKEDTDDEAFEQKVCISC